MTNVIFHSHLTNDCCIYELAIVFQVCHKSNLQLCHWYINFRILIFLSQFVHLSICPSVHLSVCPSAHLSICPSVHLTICLTINLSIFLFFLFSLQKIVFQLVPKSFWETNVNSLGLKVKVSVALLASELTCLSVHLFVCPLVRSLVQLTKHNISQNV